MPRKVRSHVIAPELSGQPMKPKHLTKQEFGKRLYSLILARGWNQSDLAREAGLNRDAISTYVRGRTLPTPQNRDAMARALGVEPDQLLPNHVRAAIAEDNPAFEMKVSTSALGMAWLRVDMLVKTSTAAKIAEMLEADNAFEGKRSGEAVALQQRKNKAPAP